MVPVELCLNSQDPVCFSPSSRWKKKKYYWKNEQDKLPTDIIKTIFKKTLWIIIVDCHTLSSDCVCFDESTSNCGSTKYISQQTFLCIRLVLSLLHDDKRSSLIVLLRLWIEARFGLFILRHKGKSLSSSGDFPKKCAPPQQAERVRARLSRSNHLDPRLRCSRHGAF